LAVPYNLKKKKERENINCRN